MSHVDTGDKLLFHQCCGPCSCYPLERILADKKFDDNNVVGFYYNPNIHPMTELYLRFENTVKLNLRMHIPYIYSMEYGLFAFMKFLEMSEKERCARCYSMRANRVAYEAKKRGIRFISSSLLYSKFQMHDIIIEKFVEASNRHGVEFFYDDFRIGWKRGIDVSKEYGLYRQQYCGCIFSEKSRYETQLVRELEKKIALLESTSHNHSNINCDI